MLYLIISISIICVILAFLYLKATKQKSELERQVTQTQQNNNELYTQNSVLTQKNEIVTESIQKERQQIEIERIRLNDTIQKEREQLTQQFSDKFQALANDILEQKSRSMTVANQQGVEALLKPLGEQLERFRTRIEEEGKHRFLLQKEVERLSELNLQITKEANNLTSALKGNSKVQGDWGEMILQTLLESSGLVRGTHFFLQENMKNEDGANLRPDVVLHLPENKRVIIDSKVSLTDYVGFAACESEIERNLLLSKHIQSVKKHIDELGVKNYHKLIDSPDFVIMFVPNEPAFLLALQNDETLWQYAYSKGVILSSPTNLFSILKIVEDLWRRDSQSKNAIEIANAGGELYDKLALFIKNFEELGRSIDKSSAMFNQTQGQLYTGRGNIVNRAEKMRKLGATTTKQISPSITDSLEEDQ